jgi:hypothetical protein
MKFNFTVITASLVLGLLTSCATNFYQVYQVTPTDNLENKGKQYSFRG